MWKYSNTLKELNVNKNYDFKHISNKKITLQNVEIRTNELGLRGKSVEQIKNKNRILFLGGSITLGWGVKENKTFVVQLEKLLNAEGLNVDVINAGIGNYNVKRYTNFFFDELTSLKPTHIILNFFVRDMEDLPKPSGNFILQNSQLAVTLWLTYQKMFNKFDPKVQSNYYKNIYSKDSKEFKILEKSFKRFKDYSTKNNVKIIVAMIPEIKTLDDYSLSFAHKKLSELSDKFNFDFIDLFDVLEKYSPKELFVLPDDPHPNDIGHREISIKLKNYFINELSKS